MSVVAVSFYKVDGTEIPQNSIVVFGGDRDIELSTTSHDPRVAGVSIDQTNDPELVFKALEFNGGENFKVIHGKLDTGKKYGDTWRLAHGQADKWLKTVAEKTKLLFKDIGKVKVGIKTTADNVFA